MEQFDTYSKFLDIRKKIIDYALANAVFSEKREDEHVRPVVKIKTAEELADVNRMIATWQVLADQLCTESPERYNRSSATFSPEPKVLYNLCDASITVNDATSTRILTKEVILTRLRKARTAERQSSDQKAKTKIARLDREIAFFKADAEECYRLRTDGYTVVILLVRHNKKEEYEKVHVSFAGVFIFDPKDECRMSLPSSDKLGNRKDKIGNLKIKPLKYSLARRGQLFRTADLKKLTDARKAEKAALKRQAPSEEEALALKK